VPDQPALSIGTVGDDARAAVATALPGAAVEPLAPPTPPTGVDCVVVSDDAADGPVDAVADLTAATDVPVVVYATDGDETLAGDAVAAGAVGYVPGPDEAALAERVRAAADAAPSTTDRLVERTPLAVVGWDDSFTVTRWNPAAEELFGWSATEALGRNAMDLVVPEAERADVEPALRTLLESGDPVASLNENVCADGSRVVCEWYNAPLVDDAGTHVVSFARDVTEQRRRNDRLAALQATARDLLRADDRAAVAESVVDAAAEVLDHPIASVRLYDAERDRLETVAMTDRATERVADPPPVGPGDGPVWESYVAGERRTVDLASADGVYGDDVSVGHVMFLPLGEHGVLTFGVDDPADLTDLDRTLAAVLARTAEAALDRAAREEELARYETIVQAAGDGVVALDAEGRYTQVNDRFAEMTGYDRDELVGADPGLVTDADDLSRAEEHTRQLRDDDVERVTYEVTMTRADGERVPVEVSQSELPGEGFTGTVGTVRDVSERKAAETALAARRERLAALHEAPTRMDDADTPGAVAEAAVAAAAELLAFDECVVRRREDDVDRLLASTTDEASSVPSLDGVYAAVHEEGDSILVEDLAASRFDADNPWGFRSVLSVPVSGTVVLQAVSRTPGAFDEADLELAELLASHVADALDRVEYERRLRDERDRLAALFENVPDPAVLGEWDGDGFRVLDVNPAFESVFGHDHDAAVGADLDDLIVPPGCREEAADVDRAIRDGEVVQREVRRTTADGLREFRLTGVPVDRDGGTELSFGVYTDVTERNQRRERVAVLNRVLRHDLRNGMNVVRGAAAQLRDTLDGDAAALAGSVYDRADGLLALAERTRAIERSLDHDTATDGPVDLAAAARRSVGRVRAEHPQADVTLSAPEHVVADGEALLADAVHDVVENAVVHSDHDSPTVDVSVGVDGDDVVVRVADDGPGIPDTERRLLTGDDEITQLNHASGLGLWLVNWAVTHSGGELAIEDADPRGSVVTVRVPAADSPVDGEPVPGGEAGD
jgi:PAS domain S-box-containing protein